MMTFDEKVKQLLQLFVHADQNVNKAGYIFYPLCELSRFTNAHLLLSSGQVTPIKRTQRWHHALLPLYSHAIKIQIQLKWNV